MSERVFVGSTWRLSIERDAVDLDMLELANAN